LIELTEALRAAKRGRDGSKKTPYSATPWGMESETTKRKNSLDRLLANGAGNVNNDSSDEFMKQHIISEAAREGDFVYIYIYTI
jgi:hypothetical protein